jgi:hypothetical protein
VIGEWVKRYVALGTLQAEALECAANAVGKLAGLLQVDGLARNRAGFHLLALDAHQ